MVLISLLLLGSLNILAQNQPKFLTKHDIKSIRFISMDGRYAYVRKKPGVLGLVSSFRNNDFLSESAQTDFLMSGSNSRNRLIIESIPFAYTEFNTNKVHNISVIDWGNTKVRQIGHGRNPKLHLQDEWISFYHPQERLIRIENLVTTKKYIIKLNQKGPNHHFPDVEMISPDTIIYTDINEQGYSALIQYNLITEKSTVIYKSPQSATGFELCQSKGYLAIGEFPFEGVSRSSKILQIKFDNSLILGGFTTIYSTTEQDVGNIICTNDSIYFVKTLKQDIKTGVKQTEVAKLNLNKSEIDIKTAFTNVTQLIEMDQRIMVPMRGEFYVLEGEANLSNDKLKSTPVNVNEELPLDI